MDKFFEKAKTRVQDYMKKDVAIRGKVRDDPFFGENFDMGSMAAREQNQIYEGAESFKRTWKAFEEKRAKK